eukprot:scaffold8407_cov32-Phaeocystis_antarctica.AAC.3
MRTESSAESIEATATPRRIADIAPAASSPASRTMELASSTWARVGAGVRARAGARSTLSGTAVVPIRLRAFCAAPSGMVGSRPSARRGGRPLRATIMPKLHRTRGVGMWLRPGWAARSGGIRAVGGAVGGAGGAPADHEQDHCREQGRDLAGVAWLGSGSVVRGKGQ